MTNHDQEQHYKRIIKVTGSKAVARAAAEIIVVFAISFSQSIADLYAMLKKHGDWMELGSADEQKHAKEGTVEAWGRSAIIN